MQLSTETLSSQLFHAHTIRELKRLASAYRIRNYGDMRKQELCDAIAAAKMPTILPVLTVNSREAEMCWSNTPMNYGYFIRSHATELSANDTRVHYTATHLLYSAPGAFPTLSNIADLIQQVVYGLLILTTSDNTVLVFAAKPADSVCAAYATPHSNQHKAQHFVYQRTQHILNARQPEALVESGWSALDTADTYIAQTVLKERVKLELMTDYRKRCNWVVYFRDLERYLVLTESEASQLYGLHTPAPISAPNSYRELMSQIHTVLV